MDRVYKHIMDKHLHYFQQQTHAKHAFQVVLDLPYEDINCFDYTTPVIVPAFLGCWDIGKCVLIEGNRVI